MFCRTIILLKNHETHVKYYCDIFAGEDYFYVLYMGHSYEEYINSIYKKKVTQKYVKFDAYQQEMPNIVEQYDWNGNPVGRYLLEGAIVFDEGKFSVDETNRQIYLLISENCVTFMSSISCSDQFIVTYPYMDDAIALSYVMRKYNMGVTLSRRVDDGSFQIISANPENKSYTMIDVYVC